jgi:hypothetical protein
MRGPTHRYLQTQFVQGILVATVAHDVERLPHLSLGALSESVCAVHDKAAYMVHVTKPAYMLHSEEACCF